MFDLFPRMREQFTSPDGRMYAVPSMNDCYHCKIGDVRTWYNSRWLDGVGASIPETLDDFDDLMAEWKTGDGKPDGSSLVVTQSDTMMSLFNFFLGSFLEVSPSHMLLRDGQVTWVPSDERYREGMIWIQEQFAKGHFSQGILSNTAEQLQQLGDNDGGPRFGIAYGNSQGDFATTVNMADPENVGNIMQALPPLEGPGGVRTCAWTWDQIGSPNFVITNSCPDPVQMIRWADYQFELGMIISMGRGERGVHWDYSDEGALGISEQQAVYEVIPQEEEPTNVGWWEWGPFFTSMSQRHGEAVSDDGTSIEPSLYQATAAYEPYRIAEELVLPALAFDMDQSAQVGEIETNLVQHLQQSFASLATGRSDFTKDGDWQAYVDQFST